MPFELSLKKYAGAQALVVLVFSSIAYGTQWAAKYLWLRGAADWLPELLMGAFCLNALYWAIQILKTKISMGRKCLLLLLHTAMTGLQALAILFLAYFLIVSQFGE